MRARAGAVLAMLAVGAQGAGLPGPDEVPHLDERARKQYVQFLGSDLHRAFAIAPGGGWGWAAEAPTRAEAEEAALARCRGATVQKCVLYVADDHRVFDRGAWVRLWGPYRTAQEAARAPEGLAPGSRFPDLAFRDEQGRPMRLSDLRGRVVVLHFWASWCGPCRHEMPDLQKLAGAMRAQPAVTFVLLQVRERFSESKAWARAQALQLPLYDSGSGGADDGDFRLSDGRRLRDRDVARAFPTSYVLDRNGLVVFSHVGPVPRWAEYEDFLGDAAARSGRGGKEQR